MRVAYVVVEFAGFSTEIFCAFRIRPICATCPTYLALESIVVIFGRVYNFCSSQLRSFLYLLARKLVCFHLRVLWCTERWWATCSRSVERVCIWCHCVLPVVRCLLCGSSVLGIWSCCWVYDARCIGFGRVNVLTFCVTQCSVGLLQAHYRVTILPRYVVGLFATYYHFILLSA